MSMSVGAREQVQVRIILNGREVAAPATPCTSLSDVLRHGVGATGTHVGCEQGVCGACTVSLDGKPVRACLTLALQADGRRVDTVEGLSDGRDLSPLQAAFRRHHALQCGFCTPGILVSMRDLLEREPQPSAARVREVLAGHLCRCTGYAPIVAAVLEAAGGGTGASETEETARDA